MAAGKSTFGRALAAEMGLDFEDLDAIFEEKEGMSISDFFKEKGEAAFRKAEQKHLRSTSVFQKKIIATGGGTPCFFDNMEWMCTQGTTIWLDTPPDTIIQRLAEEHTQRPLVAHLNPKEQRATILNLLEIRKPMYSRADYRLFG